MTTVGLRLGVPAVFHDEVHDADRRVRPDYGVAVDGAVNGYIEVKAPGKTIDPDEFTGHNLTQWTRQRDLPNLIYTNGTHWRLYRDGILRCGPIALAGEPLTRAGRTLQAVDGLETLLTDFLRWQPAPITSVNVLVRAIAPLTRLLRGEVLDQLITERRAISAGADPDLQPFTGLARDWRALLFPQADDATFADGYAQTVTFALLLARTEGIPVAYRALHQIGVELGAGHSLMGKALQLLTDDVVADFRVALDLLVRVVGAVDWPKVRSSGKDTYLHLYEDFLELYDNELRKKSGSYYTPRTVVEHMVRLVQEALVTRLGKTSGFRDPSVLTVDPAMGTGTFLHTILETVATATAGEDGPGAVAGVISQVAKRLVGFEMQMGPFAVAELRTADLLASYSAVPPARGMRLYVTDTLDDPHATQTQLGSGLQLIAASRRRANRVKATSNVTVVVGNPPYKELAVGDGGWVENGGEGQAPILEDFLAEVPGRFRAKVKNLYVYFWRWATWKVWESTSTEDAGIICFISTSGYLTGPGFTGMREYLRRHASDGWIIDLTPEGQTPDIPTRIFPGVRQPLAIGLFLRTPGTSREMPARIRYRTVAGRREEKFAALAGIGLDDGGWRETRCDWTDPLTPAADGGWDTYPAASDLLPWYAPGVFPTRTWVYAPAPETLRQRWRTLLSETDPGTQAAMFKEGRDATLTKTKRPLPGPDTHQATHTPIRSDRSTEPRPVQVGYRAFDRQWILPDSRLMDMPRPDLWAARIPGQVFVVEQHAHRISEGPGLVFSALIPDYDYFKGSAGGRTLPFLHPDGTANLPPGLTGALTTALGRPVRPHDVLAYLAGVVAHPAYTRTFADELTTPGVRVPITADPDLWIQAVAVGDQILWLHSYGAAATGPGRPARSIRYPHGDLRQPLSTAAINEMPDSLRYDPDRYTVLVGDGEIYPVRPEVWMYAVGSKNVIKSWFTYRKKDPGGRRFSPLDKLHPTHWDPNWTTELLDLLTVLTRLIELEPIQEEILASVLAGPLLSRKALQISGTLWPAGPKDRKPRRSLAGNSTPGILDI
ncbi:type ISP restriction/modification enzyme [Parafrankia elaeagni]|uniref:type ISP restriction/modification enzyme n=1 Tax=Parafrankia elaeagni TaxID=222534 RepID=UPI001E509F79|nr:type ISP restriction/modification enzyme [Parafrankia elaeagni]